MEKNNTAIAVEVIYAKGAHQQTRIKITVKSGSTIQDIIEQTGILQLHEEINLAKNQVGIFSHISPLTHIPKAGDRIEIYRPLTIDPKELRRIKAKKNPKF